LRKLLELKRPLTAYRHDFVAWHPPRIGTPHLSFDVWRQGKDSRRERRRWRPQGAILPRNVRDGSRVDGALARTFWRSCSIGRVRSRVRPVDAAGVAAGP